MRKAQISFFLTSLLFSWVVAAGAHAPDCMSRGRLLPINNSEVLEYKKTSKEQFRSRGHIEGTVTKVYGGKASHYHFQATIGPNKADTIEIIYNKSFGEIPNIAIGSQVQACGDYITARVPSGRYPASPDGALIHWVHHSPNPRKHDHGFVILDGVVYGQDHSDHLPLSAGF